MLTIPGRSRLRVTITTTGKIRSAAELFRITIITVVSFRARLVTNRIVVESKKPPRPERNNNLRLTNNYTGRPFRHLRKTIIGQT